MRVLIAASGALGLSSLEALSSKISICGVLTDKNSKGIVDYCNKHNIPIFEGNPRNKKIIESVSTKITNIDLLFSINFLYLFSKDFLSLPRLFSLNIHGSLLPKYRGRAPHVWAIINGENEIGVTIHKIDEGCDTGDILIQLPIEISNRTTGGDVLNIFNKIYPELILKAIQLVKSNKAIFVAQEHDKATYFPKRTAEDGAIDWAWEGEKIFNWVRAITKPYPGAYSYHENKKIIIWKIELVFGLNSSVEVGTSFIDSGNLYFRCKDCFILITDYEIVK